LAVSPITPQRAFNGRNAMPLTLYYHPLASFCWKPLIALHERGTPFERHLVDLGDPAAREVFRRLSPMLKMPVLRDDAIGRTILESSIIVEYLEQHYPGSVDLLPRDADLAREIRLRDRIYDCYVQEPMQKIVGDRLRPAAARDAFGVEQARASLRSAYDLLEADMAGKTWAMGAAFTMADCAAAPALYYARLNEPLGAMHMNLAAYFDRLMQRPSIACTVAEAQPYFHLYPQA
jgi:glutathione S-transferase